MRETTMNNRQQGFSLIEIMMVLTIFLIVSGAVFELLNAAQIRYRAEREFLESFQGARLGVELIVRDIHNAGYPPPHTFPGNLGSPPTPGGAYPAGTWRDPLDAPAALQDSFALGIVGINAASNIDTDCLVNTANIPAGTCDIPNQWDLILETDIDPENPTQAVEWVRYDLQRPAGAGTSTLFRTVNPKNIVGGASPLNNASNVPFVEEIVQIPTPGVLAVANNPAVFTYECDPLMADPVNPAICRAEHIKNVYVTFRVRSLRPDIQTQQFRVITIRGAGARQYPSRPAF
jgi:prepilin-type N-terminal cleavage/methylation domain-containing protein